MMNVCMCSQTTFYCHSLFETVSLTVFLKDVNPVCRLGDVEEGGCDDVVSDPPDSFLLCISENWDKLKKQLTVGLVVSFISQSINPTWPLGWLFFRYSVYKR